MIIIPQFQITFLIVSFCFGIFLATLVLKNNPHETANRTFAILCVLTNIWLIVMYLAPQPHLNSMSIYLIRLSVFIAVPQNMAFYLLTLTVPHEKLVIKNDKKIILAILTLTVMALTISPYVFRDANHRSIPTPGPGMPIFVTYSVGFSILAIFTLARKTKAATGQTKQQLQLILFGMGIMLVLIIGTILVPAALFKSDKFVAFSPLYVLVFLFFTAYAMLRYRLFGIKIIISKIAYWLTSGLILLCLFYSVALIELHYFGNLLIPHVVVFNVFLAIASAFFFQWFLQLLKFVIDRLLSKYSYDAKTVTKNFVFELNNTDSDSDVIVTLFKTVEQILDPKKQSILVGTVNGQPHFVLTKWQNFSQLEILQLENKEAINTIFEFTMSKSTLLTQELIDTKPNNPGTKLLEQLQVEVVMTIKTEALVITFMVGKKHNKDGYTNEDLELLESLVTQTGFSLSRTLKHF